MDTVGISCSIIAAFAGIITVIFSYLMWRDSKRNILKQIEKKHHKINQIENQLFLQRRSNFWGYGDGELKIKQEKLRSEIDYLKRLL